MAIWKKVCEKVSQAVANARVFFLDEDEPTPTETKPSADPTPTSVGGPYRSEPSVKPKKVRPPKELKLVCTLTNEDAKSVDTIKSLKEKTRRRALRHFEGKEVRHRVTEKKTDSIEFSFFRRSGKPVKIRWQKPGAQTEQTPPGV